MAAAAQTEERVVAAGSSAARRTRSLGGADVANPLLCRVRGGAEDELLVASPSFCFRHSWGDPAGDFPGRLPEILPAKNGSLETGEARRIKRCNGRVFAHQDEPDAARLWLPNCNSPGLAMARAFGDFCLKDFGLISVPEITYRRIIEKDEFIVLATDGVWDVLSNQEVVEVVASCSGGSAAARAVVDLANQSWKFKYPTSKTDACAVICLFLSKDVAAGGLSGLSVGSKGIGSSLRMPARLRNPQHSSKRVIPEEADDELDSNMSGDERSLEGFTRLNTLLALPKLGDTIPTTK